MRISIEVCAAWECGTLMAIAKRRKCVRIPAMATLYGLGIWSMVCTMGCGVWWRKRSESVARCGGVSAADAQHVCGVPSVELMRSMPSPQHCEHVQRVNMVRLYIGKRRHATGRVRQPV